MAEKALRRLEEELNCSICLDTYTDPKLLQCFHVYCRQCLVPLVDRDQQGQLGLTCPNCRQVTPIPDRGVAGLQPAFHINRLLEIQESFQEAENPAAIPEGAAPADVNPVKKARHCFVHEGKELELYCETCGELICWKCMAKGSKHHDHDYDELGDAIKKYRVEITSLIEPMEKQVSIIEKALTKLDACCKEISDQRMTTEDNIHTTFRRLREVLNVRETELTGQIHQITQEKLKGLAAQRDQIETTLAQLNSCLHFMRESLRTGNEEDVLMMKTNTVSQVKELTTPFRPDTLEPSTVADIKITVSADAISMCQNYGQVYASGSSDPSQYHIIGWEAAVVGRRSTAVLQVEGKPCERPIKTLECEIVSDVTGVRANCTAGVKVAGEWSRYEIGYQPTIKGSHHLHIKVQGQHVRGSPLWLAVKDLGPVNDRVIGSINGYLRVATNLRGEVVACYGKMGSGYVSVFSPGGKMKLRSFKVRGKASSGVAVGCGGNILLTDAESGSIQVYTIEGKFVAAVGGEENRFGSPRGIAFSAANTKIYVADRRNHCILVLNSDLSLSSTFGSKGSAKGQFNRPRDVACDSGGKVYVADAANHRIQVFTAEGRFCVMFGSCGEGRGELRHPSGVAVDWRGRVYVSELSNHRVSVFTSEGQFVTSFGRKGQGPGEFDSPRGIVVDNCGVVYVCDHNHNGVQIF